MDVKSNSKKMVLQKYLSSCAVASRRKCEQLIAEGKVKINEKIAVLGDRVDPFKDKVTVGGEKLQYNASNRRYIMLNKPRGFITTMNDEKGRKCVAQLINNIPERIYPVGRLDKDSEGLLVMTNDGDFANMLIHPSKNIWKTYRVTIKPSISEKQLNALCAVGSVDGSPVEPPRIIVLSQEKERSVLEISIKEGRNRQVRKMCESVGANVARLKRTSIGHLKLGMLKPGTWRDLNRDEINLFLQNKL